MHARYPLQQADGSVRILQDIAQLIPVLRVNWSTFRSAEEMARQIQQQYAAMRSIKRVDWDSSAEALPTPLPTTPPQLVAKPRYEVDAPQEDEDGTTQSLTRAMDNMHMPTLSEASAIRAVGSESPN